MKKITDFLIVMSMVAFLFSCSQKLKDNLDPSPTKDLTSSNSGMFSQEYYDLLSKVEQLNPEYDLLVEEGRIDEADALKIEIEKIEYAMTEMGGGPMKGIIISKENILEKK